MGKRKKISRAIMERVRARGVCARCGVEEGPFEVDHMVPVALGGSNDESNLQLLCRMNGCHLTKTVQDVKKIAKARRIEAKRLGTATKRWKRKLDGKAVYE